MKLITRRRRSSRLGIGRPRLRQAGPHVLAWMHPEDDAADSLRSAVSSKLKALKPEEARRQAGWQAVR